MIRITSVSLFDEHGEEEKRSLLAPRSFLCAPSEFVIDGSRTTLRLRGGVGRDPFFAEDDDAGRGLETEADAVALDAEDLEDDPVADDDPFTDPARENEHG
jgi:hypothetical protein